MSSPPVLVVEFHFLFVESGKKRRFHFNILQSGKEDARKLHLLGKGGKMTMEFRGEGWMEFRVELFGCDKAERGMIGVLDRLGFTQIMRLVGFFMV